MQSKKIERENGYLNINEKKYIVVGLTHLII